MNKIRIGADPEVFISRDRKIISVEGLLGGTKEKPAKSHGWGKGYFVQEDNVLAEYNIPPASTSDQFIRSNLLMLNRIPVVIKANTGTTTNLEVISSHEFMKEELTSKQALLFGCDPDFNIWEIDYNDQPEASGTLRTAGGHIHIGYSNEAEIEDQINIGKFADLFLGVPSVLYDLDTKRKTLYGKAGAIRFKDYGIEYRVLSNFWLTNVKLMKWAFDSAVKSAVIGMENDFPEELSKLVQHIINNNDIVEAKNLIETLKDTKFKI